MKYEAKIQGSEEGFVGYDSFFVAESRDSSILVVMSISEEDIVLLVMGGMYSIFFIRADNLSLGGFRCVKPQYGWVVEPI
ncbi:MAG: hypothetical protein PHW52_02825 [Candidatus Pacebacteria bacterium]|nr:hypothetical protein [Candidatus Paceibacterota bacterium]